MLGHCHVVVSAELVLEFAEPAKIALGDSPMAQRSEEEIRRIAQLLYRQAQLMAGLGREAPEVLAAFQHFAMPFGQRAGSE
jgi:hypothetical protein